MSTTNNLLNSYISTLSTDRKSSPKTPQSISTSTTTTTTKDPPKTLSKSFQKQLANTLAPPAKKFRARRKKKILLALNERRKKTSSRKMSKRAAPVSETQASSRSKKVKTASLLPEMEKDQEDQPFWEISGKRRLLLSEFKGTTMVGIREFYEKDGEALPGKKGISMTVEQFDTVVRLLPEIERELKGKGLVLGRPKYDDVEGGEEEDGEEDKEEEEEDGEEEDEEEGEDEEDEEGEA